MPVQDPRLVIDPTNNTVLIASIAIRREPEAKIERGDVNIVTFHWTRATTRSVLHRRSTPRTTTTPRPCSSGRMGDTWRCIPLHNRENLRITEYPRVPMMPAIGGPNGRLMDIGHRAAGANCHVTYSNLFYLPAEKRTYDFSHAINDDPSILISRMMATTGPMGENS